MTLSPPRPAADLAAQAAILGFAVGLRSATPPALLALAARPRANRRAFAADADRPLSLLRASRAPLIGGLAAAGEFVADKLPMVPSRLEPGPFAGRVVVGTLVGAAVYREAHGSQPLGAALGAATAGMGAVVGTLYRTRLGRVTHLPDVVLAVAEDAASVGLGVLALRRYLL